MILLTEVSSIEEYYRLKLLFANKGVLIHTANEDTARNFGVFHPVGKYAVFVLLEEQLEDAKQLLVNEDHCVANSVDIDAYQAHKKEHQNEISSRVLIVLSLATACLATVFLALAFFT